MTSTKSLVFLCKGIEIHEQEFSIVKRGEVLPVEPRAFRVLLYLLRNPQRLITKEELLQSVWDDVVVTENSLARAILKLRQSLGDDAKSPQYIETVSRVGYRFVASVEVLEPPAVPLVGPRVLEAGRPGSDDALQLSLAAAAMLPEGRRRSRFGRWAGILAAIAITLLAGAFAAYRFWPRSNTPSGRGKIMQISQWNKPMRSACLSPDGHTVAFVSPVGGVSQVFLMLTSGGEPLQLTNDESEKFVVNFSPDGKEVYYTYSISRDEVWAVPALGGSPHRVVPARWVLPTPDGNSIFYRKAGNSGIFRAGKSGFNEELVYKPKDSKFSFRPFLLFPSGNDLLISGWLLDAEQPLLRVNLTSHEATDLGELPPSDFYSYIVWAEPGSSVLSSRTVNGLTNIWKYNLGDRTSMQITFGPGPDYSPMADPGGRGIYYVNGKSSGFLTAYHVHAKESKDIVSKDATQPVISRDGKRVMYVTRLAHAMGELWVSDLEGENKVKIAAGAGLVTGSWAPDNFHMSYVAESKGYIVGADGSGLRQLPQMRIPFIGNILWSPDQKSLYASGEGAGVSDVWKWNMDGLNAEKFIGDCTEINDVDPGGKYLLGAAARGENPGIFEVSISDKKCISLLPGVLTYGVRFARDGKSFLYAVASRGEVEIYRQPWADGKLTGSAQVALKVPFAFPIYYYGNGYDFSPDLSTIVYARRVGNADLYLLSQK